MYGNAMMYVIISPFPLFNHLSGFYEICVSPFIIQQTGKPYSVNPHRQ
jgi:hypothetical protein